MPVENLADAERRTRVWRREQRLRRLGYENYAAYLDSPAWRELRGQFWDGDALQKCSVCEGTEAKILHHKTYVRVGAEQLDDLAPLCEPCHLLVHELERRGDLDLDFEGLVNRARRQRVESQPTIPQELLRARELFHKNKPILERDLQKALSKGRESTARLKLRRLILAKQNNERVEKEIREHEAKLNDPQAPDTDRAQSGSLRSE